MKLRIPLTLLMVLFLAFSACRPAASSPPGSLGAQAERLKVVATTTIVGDVVQQIGGDWINLVVLLPPGSDPHSFQPAPRDVAGVADADLVFMNGAGLETFMESLLRNAGGVARLVEVSDGIVLIQAEHDQEPTGEEHHNGDPHVWMDPNNVMVWVENIARALSAQDPANASAYQQNADQYRKSLEDLDQWVRAQVAQVPEQNRGLVVEHAVLGYFAQRYGFQQVGAVIPSFSTLAEPSAQELVALEDAIRKLGVTAIFVGNTVNPALAQRVAEDTAIRLVPFYSDSLTGAGGPASTYLEFMRYNVSVFVEALK